MEILLRLWTKRSQREVRLGTGAGATMRAAMIAALAPLGQPGCRYEEKDGQGFVTRTNDAGEVMAIWRGRHVATPDSPSKAQEGPVPATVHPAPATEPNSAPAPARPARVRLAAPEATPVRVGGLIKRPRARLA